MPATAPGIEPSVTPLSNTFHSCSYSCSSSCSSWWWWWTHFHSRSSSQYTLTSPLLPYPPAPADATFSCGQRLHCISHLRLISGKSRVVVEDSGARIAELLCKQRGGPASLTSSQYMQGSARVVTFEGQVGGSPTYCKGLLPARGQLAPLRPAAGAVPFTGENMGSCRERWALRTGYWAYWASHTGYWVYWVSHTG